MIADHDRQDNPQWPFAGDRPTERARRVARMYREVLRRVAQDEADVLDGRARHFGECWLDEFEQLVDDDRELTTAEAAELANVSPKTIRNWAALDHPEQPGAKLLPRAGRSSDDSRETTYLARNVREAVKARRRAQFARSGGMG